MKFSNEQKFISVMGIVIAVISIVFLVGEQQQVFSGKYTKTVVIDAGHGLPDGGAVGMNGTIESTINIMIAKKTEKRLKKSGFNVIMTRKDDFAIGNRDNPEKNFKREDMRKRLEIINSSGADIFVSIHMNKFTDSRYSGAQVIYSPNYKESQVLAECIQKSFCSLKENKSKRAALKAPQSIYLLRNANIPAVIAECGFLSNYDEEKLLNTEKYRNKLADALAKGIEDYYKYTEKGSLK